MQELLEIFPIRHIYNPTYKCERENDADGLRILRRIMVPYFRNKSKEATSLYARYTLIDLVMEHSASDRTRARMDYLVCVNPSGIRGGFMFRDKYRASNEGFGSQDLGKKGTFVEKARKSRQMRFHIKTAYVWGLGYD